MTLVDTIVALQDHVQVELSHIITAAKAAQAKRTELTEILNRAEGPLPSDTGMLVFGSLARDEWTSGSDLDWTLLLNGPVDPRHRRVARDIRDALAKEDKKKAGTAKTPGPTGTFGGMAFSHEIVHHIGGERDTNANMTRRILLLLESRSIGQTSGGQPDDVRDQVLRAVIDRYLEDDPSHNTTTEERMRVPRFLLNDVVRFWRTMAVDYVSKRRDRDDRGWALRNIKLRFSRKLIFVSGLLTCFGAKTPELFESLIPRATGGSTIPERVGHLRAIVELPPLKILAHAAESYCEKATVTKMYVAYNEFLGMLSDDQQRQELEKLVPDCAQSNELFQSMRAVSRDFQDSLNTLFFGCNEQLTDFSKEYGLF